MFGSHPANLAFRFVLELLALAGLAWGGFALAWSGWGRIVQAVVLPVTAAVVWGTFAVPDDPSRSGRAPVPVPGWVRLVVEFVVFGAGVAGFLAANAPGFSLALGVGGLVHYVLSLDRIRWLLGGG